MTVERQSTSLPTSEFDEVGEDYEAQLQIGLAATGEEGSFFARARLTWFGQRLNEHGHAPRSLLDYGCGTGSATPLFFELLPSLRSSRGVDVSKRLLELARASHSCDRSEFVLIEDRNDLGDFDVAYTNGVFHHIPLGQRRGALQYILKSLRPGGFFAFWENNPWNPGTRYVMRHVPFDREAKPLSAPRARALLCEAGFEVVRTDFLFIFPHFLRGMRRFERWMVRLPIGGQYMVLARRPL